MLAAERRRAIARAVASRPSVRTEELAAEFGVSGETIRRDLLALDAAGELSRVYGGATPADSVRRRLSEGTFADREHTNVEAKRRIAAAAAGQLEDGLTVSIDVGTTMLELARALPAQWRGRVLTNSLLVAAEVADRPDVELVVSGGAIRAGDLACSGARAAALFSDYYADIAFLASGGIDAKVGLSDYYPAEVDVRKVMLTHSARSVVLADSTKIGVIAPRRVCGLDEIGQLVTDTVLPAAVAAALEPSRVLVAA
ncbi:DeoR family transcriptional regulator [Motilibacter rhizosphaerae]|uniref:Lactose phosphotransferase system repressor n=1 Tax=Motilibacter rhizosphaerae TaxID=598652 RepID=A0A4V2F2E4_9ACTN|nr:DeoR/GlpR family DNA-binding transcription regulator [Motilibacter rhizosphaerae]RZS77536.1 DeoR family transcriptional regulator [Motilibacter rhizosphaerae]